MAYTFEINVCKAYRVAQTTIFNPKLHMGGSYIFPSDELPLHRAVPRIFLVFIACIECVTKRRLTGDCHVWLCEQLRGEFPFAD
jgi:hypothetical protein